VNSVVSADIAMSLSSFIQRRSCCNCYTNCSVK